MQFLIDFVIFEIVVRFLRFVGRMVRAIAGRSGPRSDSHDMGIGIAVVIGLPMLYGLVSLALS